MTNLKLLLAASCLTAILAGCGGSSDSGSSPSPNPTPTPDPAPNNQAPTVSITGDSEALEGTAVSLKASATDSDGQVVSYSWSVSTGPSITLSNSTTSDVSFTTPDVTEDTAMVLAVTVTDDDGATATATKNFSVKRLVRSVTLTGIVTDAPVANASLMVYVGDETFPATAGNDGTYTVQLDIDDSAVNQLIRIKANGGTNQQNVEFYSQLESFTSVATQAGDDGIVNSSENFGVNVTNVTTAEYALITRAIGGIPQSTNELNNALVGIDANEKLTLSALIKLVVDGSGGTKFSLPAGVNNTFELVSSQSAVDELTNTINDADPTLIDKTKEEIKKDDKLVDNGEGSIVGDYLIGSTRWFRSPFTEMTLNENGTGTFTNHTSGAITWTQATNGAVSIVFGDGIFSQRHRCKNAEGKTDTCYSRYKTATFTIYDDNDFAKAISLTAVRDEIKADDDTVLNADVIDTEDLTMVVRNNTITPTAAQMPGTWHFDQMYYLMGGKTGEEYYAPQAGKMVFNQDGTGKSTMPDGTERDFSWQVSDNNLVVMLAKTGTMEAKTLTYWLLKTLQDGFQFWAITNDAVATEPDKKASMTHRHRKGIMMPEQAITLNDTMAQGRFIPYSGANLPQNYFFDNYVNGVSYNRLNKYTDVWEIDSRTLSIKRYYDSMNKRNVYQCPEGATPENCSVNSSTSYQVLSMDNNSWYVRYSFTNANEPSPGSSYIAKYVKTDTNLTQFDYMWMDNRTFQILNDNNQVEQKYYFLNYSDDDTFTRVIRDTNFSEIGTFSVKSGKLHSDESGSVTVSDLKGFDRDYIKVCNYPLDTNCEQGVEKTYYLNRLAADKTIMAPAPPTVVYSTKPLNGAWYDPTRPDFVVVIRDGKWVHMELKTDTDPDGKAGLEVGYADWDEQTGEFMVDLVFDSNGVYGFDASLKHTLMVEGDKLTIDIEGEPSFTLSRLVDANNPLVGAYVEYPLYSGRIWISAFLPGNKFFEADYESADSAKAGINYGSFNYDASTGRTELTFELNQISDSDPIFAMFLNGDVIQWKDGNDLGTVQRVKPSSDQPMFDSHTLMYERFALIAGSETMYIDFHIGSGQAEVVADGKTRTYTWSINQGQLTLMANTPATGLSAEGYVISPSSKLDDGWKVSVLKMMEPQLVLENDPSSSYMQFNADMRR
ncbi:PKD domain-containing protein [Pseudoalteromonas rubra]|uniref:PKD domain-containing protein n=1 Tax=Pseudoalteromonas rubra TaxID=43658 RepID=UPI000F7A9629|nr:PKD domain-containing protein [Pseudoalteromonas rubra]